MGIHLHRMGDRLRRVSAPEWFAFDQIPFQKMWADDALWYPLFLSGKTFEGEFYFENTHDLKRHELRETTT